MQTTQQSIVCSEEYLVHYSDGPGHIQTTVVRGDPFTTLFHSGQTRKVVKVERQQVQVIRTVLKSEDVSEKYKQQMSMWDHKFTRLHAPDGTRYISDSKKAKEIYARLVELYGKDKLAVDALVNVYLAKKFTRETLVALEDLVANNWGSTCRASILTDDDRLVCQALDNTHKCALSIIVLDSDEHLKDVVASLSTKSDLTLVIICSPLRKSLYDDDYGWKVFQSTRIYLLQCQEESELSTSLNYFVLSNVNARYLAPNMQ